MDFEALIQEAKKFEIDVYQKTPNLHRTHVPFSGAPRRHPYDVDKLILVPDPFSTNTHYYEFDLADIDHVEELPSIVSLEGKTVSMIRVWLGKGSIGVRCTPFVVEDTARKRVRRSGSEPAGSPQAF